MAKRGLVSPVTSSKAARTAFCTGWSDSTYSAPRRGAGQRQEPGMLARAVVVHLPRRGVPAGQSRFAACGIVGHLRPAAQRRLPSDRSASQRVTRSVWIAAPLCDAQAEREVLGRQARRPSRRRFPQAAAPASSCRPTAGRSPAPGSPQASHDCARRRRRSPHAHVQRLDHVAAPDFHQRDGPLHDHGPFLRLSANLCRRPFPSPRLSIVSATL
jgi:hypothetical protein